MDLEPFFTSLEATGLATGIRNSLFWFPTLEAIHVIGLAVVFGTIIVVDLRLLGFASAARVFDRLATELLKWTWVAFAVTALTGALMFITNAHVYATNTYFLIKMVLLALAGLNMLVFHVGAGRRSHAWGAEAVTPALGKAAAALSICLWVAVIFAGRLIGFTTTGQAVEAAPPPGVNFEDFLGGGDVPGAPADPAAAPPAQTVPAAPAP